MARHRMLLSIDDELHAIFKELSEITGMPAAAFATSFLTELKPQLRAMSEAMRLAKAGSSEALEKVMMMVDSSKKEATSLQKDLRKDIAQQKKKKKKE